MNDKVVCPCGVRIRHSDATTVAGALVLNEDDVVEAHAPSGLSISRHRTAACRKTAAELWINRCLHHIGERPAPPWRRSKRPDGRWSGGRAGPFVRPSYVVLVNSA